MRTGPCVCVCVRYLAVSRGRHTLKRILRKESSCKKGYGEEPKYLVQTRFLYRLFLGVSGLENFDFFDNSKTRQWFTHPPGLLNSNCLFFFSLFFSRIALEQFCKVLFAAGSEYVVILTGSRLCFYHCLSDHSTQHSFKENSFLYRKKKKKKKEKHTHT